MTEIATATVGPSNYSFADDRRNDRINDTRNDIRMTQETNGKIMLRRGRAEQ